MGYHAPSAEEVYRYVLRFDQPNRKLTDRFNLSIIFVNDTSPLCRDFLKQYCVDLCFRTADRIRFVFFSELSQPEIQNIADKMNRGQEGLKRGMLRNILDMVGVGRSRGELSYDFESEFWRSLRPEALYPLSRLDDIEKQLNWECDMKTALPGSGMAMQFAQRLGIGRYAPCVLVFNEIGNLQIDLMPIEGMSTKEIYHHIRGWIDNFYEINQVKIDYWGDIERKIDTLVNNANLNIQSIRTWHEKYSNLFERLRKTSELILKIENTPDEQLIDLIRLVLSDYSWPSEIRSIFQTGKELVQVEDQRLSAIRVVHQAQEKLVNISDANTLLANLLSIRRMLLPNMNVDVSKSLNIAIKQLESLSRTDYLYMIDEWWKKISVSYLSFKKFKQYRYKWIHEINGEYFNARDEYNLVVNLLLQSPVLIDTDTCKNLILSHLAEYYHLERPLETWYQLTIEFQNYLSSFLVLLTNQAPYFVRNGLNEVTIGDVIPTSEQLANNRLKVLLNQKPKLAGLIASAENSKQNLGANFQEHIRIISAEFDAYLEKITNAVTDIKTIKEDTLNQLRQRRRALEVEVNSANRGIKPKTGIASKVAPEVLEELTRALDQYDTIIQSIEYPHRSDPAVRTVPLRASIAAATQIHTNENQVNVSELLRNDIQKVIQDEAKAISSLPEIYKEIEKLTPSAKLTFILKTAIDEPRLSGILADFSGTSLQEKIENTVSDGRVPELISELTDIEQDRLISSLNSSQKNRNVQNTNIGRAAMILTALGLYRGKASLIVGTDGTNKNKALLNRKIAKDEFDIFMAHHPLDRSAVLGICRHLRERGIYPWVDIEQIPPGKWLQDVIQAVIPKVRCAAIIVGKSGVEKWQKVELRAFISQCAERELPVIPILLPQVKEIPNDLVFLQGLNAVKFHHDVNENEPMQHLVWGITGEKGS